MVVSRRVFRLHKGQRQGRTGGTEDSDLSVRPGRGSKAPGEGRGVLSDLTSEHCCFCVGVFWGCGRTRVRIDGKRKRKEAESKKRVRWGSNDDASQLRVLAASLPPNSGKSGYSAYRLF